MGSFTLPDFNGFYGQVHPCFGEGRKSALWEEFIVSVPGQSALLLAEALVLVFSKNFVLVYETGTREEKESF